MTIIGLDHLEAISKEKVEGGFARQIGSFSPLTFNPCVEQIQALRCENLNEILHIAFSAGGGEAVKATDIEHEVEGAFDIAQVKNITLQEDSLHAGALRFLARPADGEGGDIYPCCLPAGLGDPDHIGPRPTSQIKRTASLGVS